MSARTCQTKHAQGFTLIEVLVALVIVTIALFGLMDSSSSSIRNLSFMQDKSEAQWVAMSLMSNVRTDVTFPNVGSRSGDIEAFGKEWQWFQKISKVPAFDDVRRVDISVATAEGDEDSALVTLAGFVVNPKVTSEE